ncbi:MAG: NADH:ubiquinone reductase (Na(+)-transporting) subunit C [Sodalis sp. (in: enterobacteria)]
MRKNKIIISLLMLCCVFCFSVIAVYFLIRENNNVYLADDQRIAAIIRVVGLLRTDDKTNVQTIKDLYHNRVIARLVNLDNGTLLPNSFPQARLKSCSNLSADPDLTKIRQRCNIGEVYFLHKKNEIQQIVLPIYGKGAKSMMYALLALAPDGRTVQNLFYYQQNETPLLGATVEDPVWLHQWIGKKILNEQAQPALKVVQPSSKHCDIYTIDGITGATMTSVGVEKSVNFWMGEQGYGPFLQRFIKDKAIPFR